MRVHHHPLLLAEPLGLQQHGIRDADLADVVEQAAPLERLQVRIAEPHRPPDFDADALHVLGVLAVNGSRLSTASASAPMVWVNMRRISTNRWYPIRVMYSGTANKSVAHHVNS